MGKVMLNGRVDNSCGLARCSLAVPDRVRPARVLRPETVPDAARTH